MLSQPVVPTVTYTSAKVVLVGESNAGKSYLAHRITTGEVPEQGTIKTTHGMKRWTLKPERLCPAARGPEDQHREVVLWDMGGQEEYRLIHQLFLHDTMVALVLFDPTRGAREFREVETWNKYLEKQLYGSGVVKLLVGAKLDEPSDMIHRRGVERLVNDCGFSGYYESSALSGRGVPALCEAIANAIDWDRGKTSRPELFQRIRDDLEARRKRDEVVVDVSNLVQSLLGDVALAAEEDLRAIDAVTEQLAAQGEISLVRDPEKYQLRLEPFSNSFFHKFVQEPYPRDYAKQCIVTTFRETSIQFIALNSCWQIDQFYRKRSGLHVEAVAYAIAQALKQEEEARAAGQLPADKTLLRIAVWHHSIAGPEQMRDTDFIGNLQKNGVRLILHGDVHEERRDLIGYWHPNKVHVIASGSFGARAGDLPESKPRLYNVLEVARDLKSVRVHTRSQPQSDGPWKGFNEWPRKDGKDGAVPYYDIEW